MTLDPDTIALIDETIARSDKAHNAKIDALREITEGKFQDAYVEDGTAAEWARAINAAADTLILRRGENALLARAARDALAVAAAKPPSPRIISIEELQQEDARRTVRCTDCKEWIRYAMADRITDKPRDRRYVVCPGCGCERVLAIGGIK